MVMKLENLLFALSSRNLQQRFWPYSCPWDSMPQKDHKKKPSNGDRNKLEHIIMIPTIYCCLRTDESNCFIIKRSSQLSICAVISTLFCQLYCSFSVQRSNKKTLVQVQMFVKLGFGHRNITLTVYGWWFKFNQMLFMFLSHLLKQLIVKAHIAA